MHRSKRKLSSRVEIWKLSDQKPQNALQPWRICNVCYHNSKTKHEVACGERREVHNASKWTHIQDANNLFIPITNVCFLLRRANQSLCGCCICKLMKSIQFLVTALEPTLMGFKVACAKRHVHLVEPLRGWSHRAVPTPSIGISGCNREKHGGPSSIS